MGKGQMGKSSESEGKAWGHGKFANMPTEVKMDMYPKAVEFGPTVENDSMTRIDEENRRSDSRARSRMSNQH
jgi:hypothetical protein